MNSNTLISAAQELQRAAFVFMQRVQQGQLPGINA
jgi:hypothetical protein